MNLSVFTIGWAYNWLNKRGADLAPLFCLVESYLSRRVELSRPLKGSDQTRSFR